MDNKIIIVQGDDYPLSIEVYDSDNELVSNATIDKMYMTCEYENYQGEFTYNETSRQWELTIPSAATKLFKPTGCNAANFDITVVYTNTIIQTEIYRGEFICQYKNNKVVY